MAHTPTPGTIPELGALELRARIVAQALTARDVAEALLTRIAVLEPEIRAWVWHNPDDVLAQADRLDAAQRVGKLLGPLHGVPVALKDIIDTKGIPTELGCTVTAGRVPVVDAKIVQRLRAAGALIMGKTVTTELAFMHPGPTRNPLNPDHTPGGSSSGSAAAVAAGMVPLAIGTQTGGSVIRPAAYCGIIGFKPSLGLIPREGVLTQCPTLDTVGVFARSLRDAALLAECLAGIAFPSPASRARQPMRLALMRLPGVDPAHFEELRAALLSEAGDDLEIVERALPVAFDHVARWRECINFAEMAHHYRWLEEKGGAALSPETRAAMADGAKALAADYLQAKDAMERTHDELQQKLVDCDAILSTATPGRAPKGLGSTGSSICNGVWTFVGGPAITVPVPHSQVEGLPIGVQVSALRGQDSVALNAAQRVSDLLLR